MRQESGLKGVPTEMLVLGWQAAGSWLLHKKGKGAGDSELSLTVVLTPLKGGQGGRQCRSPRACSPGTAGCVHYCGLPPRPDLAPPTACTLSAATAGPVTAPTNTMLKTSTRIILEPIQNHYYNHLTSSLGLSSRSMRCFRGTKCQFNGICSAFLNSPCCSFES